MLSTGTLRFWLTPVVALPLLACDAAQTPDAGSDDELANPPASTDASILPNIRPDQRVAEAGPPELQPLGDNPDVDLGPTLGGCSFAHQGEVLFIAGAPADVNARGRGVIKIGGLDRLLTGTSAGGPEAVNAGSTMTNGEYTVEIRRGAGEGEPFGIESLRWPANLVLRKDMAEPVTIYSPGTWTCGV